jgi:hypothetical protein
MEYEYSWRKVIAGKTNIKGQQFTVIAHAVRTNRVEMANQENALAELQAQNPQLKNIVKVLKWHCSRHLIMGGCIGHC